MTQALEKVVLRNTCELLSTASNWTSGAWARTQNGERCGPLSIGARQWCAWGALQKCAYEVVGQTQVAREIADRISEQLVPGPGGLIFLNEQGGYDVVRAVMRSGGPPPGVERTWCLHNFRHRKDLAAFVRGALSPRRDRAIRADAKDLQERKSPDRRSPSKGLSSPTPSALSPAEPLPTGA
jgi:hypothetical protein